jgi:WD40 repeat protein
MMTSPFKFLDSYTKEDRTVFFGRDREIEELYQKVFDSKLLLVYGVSGTGKSSLINCGLANKFHETDWLPLLIRRGGNIIESLAASIKTASITPQHVKLVDPADFKKGVKSLYLDFYKPVFFIFDQFEELFIFGDKDERKEFILIVKALIESDLQCRLIFVMREEYMAGVTEFEKFIPTFFANRVRIEKMSHANALEAIKEPCKVFNISLDEGFAESLLEKLSPGSTDVELTYLQVFLDKLFRFAKVEMESQKNTTQLSFTQALLNKTGNVSDLLGSFLDDQISMMDDPGTALLILKSLVSVQGTKRQMSSKEIQGSVLTFGSQIKESVLQEMLHTFINLRILHDRDDDGKVELRHDALAAKIFEKFTIAEKELLDVRKYIENSFYTFEKRGLLLSKQDLDYLAAYDKNLILPQNLEDFVNLSRQKLQTRQKKLIRITRISTLIFILILAIVGRFYLKTQKDSVVNDLFGQALIESEKNPVKGLFTELKLWKKDSSSTQLHNIILRDFQKLLSMQVDSSDPIFFLQEYLKPLKMESVIVHSEISTNGKYIFGWLENQSVFVYSTLSKKVRYFKAEGVLEQIEISEKDSILALVYRNNMGTVCDYNGNKQYTFETTLNKVLNEKLVCFFPSGKYQLAIVQDHGVLILDSSGRTAFKLNGHSERVNSVDVSPDGRFVVTASGDKRSYIWNYNQNIKKFSIYDSLIGHTDTIWSCRFNKTGKYIITASEDSTIRIWNFKGRQLNPQFMFALNSSPGSRARYNNKEFDEDASNPLFAKYYSKFCDASFSPDEKEIIASGYTIDNDSTGNIIPKYREVLFYDRKSRFPGAYGRSFFLPGMDRDTIIPRTFRELLISPNEKVAAAVDGFSEKIYLLAGDGRQLITRTGHIVLFSKDGKGLFWISGNEINEMPIGPAEIKRLIEKFRISELSRIKESNFAEI